MITLTGCFVFLSISDRWWRGWPEERHTAVGDLCSRNTDVHGTEKQQEIESLVWAVASY